MSKIPLKRLLAAKKSQLLLSASKKLVNQPNTRLNCTGVNYLSRRQFKQLFSQIPPENIRTEINRYLDIDTINEELYILLATYIESELKEIERQSPKAKNVVLIIILGIVINAIILASFYYRHKQEVSLYNNHLNPTEIERYKLKNKSITIGILGSPERYEPLIDYLQSKLDKKVKITLDGSENLPYQLAINRIQLKQWDLAFTLSPTVSLAAEDSNYIPIARMYAHHPPYYQSVMFVRKDSKIQSMDDITAETKIALGSDDSASSFYLPLYYLYGEKLHIYRNYRSQEIKDLVKDDKIDIGVGALGGIITEEDLEKDFRIILQSMNIPSGSVYLSPTLEDEDRQILTNLINNAPDRVTNKDRANYGDPETPIDYTDYREVIESVEKTITCADFTLNPVSLYCPEELQYLELIGKVQDWRSKNNRYQLTIVDRDRQKHKVYLDKNVATEIIGQDNPIYLKDKKVKIKYVTRENDVDIFIKNPLQLKILP